MSPITARRRVPATATRPSSLRRATLRATLRAAPMLLSLTLTACGGRPAAPPAVDDGPVVGAGCSPIHDARGTPTPIRVTVPPGVAAQAGRLLVVSRVPAEAAAVLVDEGRVPLGALMDFIRHARVFVLEAQPDTLVCLHATPDAAPDGTAVALAGFGEHFWPALLGRGGRELVGAASADGGITLTGFDALVATDGGPPPPGHCSGPRFVHLTGDDPAHHACALLPPDHDPSRRYPAVYMLSGLAGDDTNRFGWDGFVPLADAIAAELGPVVFIGVNGRAPMGSIYPTEARQKAWLDWLTGDLQAAAEALLGVDPARDGLFGQSTGGFNAVSVALLRAGAFRAVAASAPDALDLRGWLLDDDGLRPEWLAWMRLEAGVGGAGQMVSYAAAWSSDGAAMPADLDTGVVRTDVLDAWLAHSPLTLLEAPAGQAAMRALDGRLHLAVAENDDFGLYPPVKTFAARLDVLGIGHRVHLDRFGHFGLDQRLPTLMRALVADLDPAP